MVVRVTTSDDFRWAGQLCVWYEDSAKKRGTGIAKRDPDYIKKKMENENAVIAFDDEGKLAGFTYIETFEEEKFVVNSGLIIRPDLRGTGVGKLVKHAVFKHTRTKYPKSKVISITTSLAVMRLNADLGYRPVTLSELTQSDDFWQGCKSCKNYPILVQNERKMCLCTGLIYDKLDDKFAKKTNKENDKDEESSTGL